MNHKFVCASVYICLFVLKLVGFVVEMEVVDDVWVFLVNITTEVCLDMCICLFL